MPQFTINPFRKDNDEATVELDSLVSNSIHRTASSIKTETRRSGRPTGQVRRWTPDLLAWFLAFAFLMAIVGLLKHWDDRHLSQWTFGITLNALLSILTTFLYLFLMMPVSSCIAQLKWNTLHQPQPLFDFALVDNASRSAFGSARLILTRPLFALPVIGAVTTLAVQAVGPFIQQIISQDYARTAVGQGVLQIANNVYSVSAPFGDNLPGSNGDFSDPVDMPTSAAFYSGIFTTQYVDYNSSYQPACGSTNCTWLDTYYSLGICSSCANINQHITHWYYNTSSSKYNITLASGHSIQNTDSNETYPPLINYPMMNVSTGSIQSLAFVNVSATLLDFSVINFWPETNRTVATECVLRVCGQAYTSTLNQSRFIETPIGLPLYPIDQSGSWPMTPYRTGLPIAAFSIVTPGSNLNLSMEPSLAHQYGEWLLPLFNNNAGLYPGFSYDDGHKFQYSNIIAQPMYTATNSTDPSFSLPVLMDNVARSLTLNLRTSSGQFVNGTEWNDELRVRTSWGWIALPTLLLVAALALLIATVVDTRNKGLGVWRASSLAVMLHGLDDKDRMLAGQSNDMETMEARAKKIDAVAQEVVDGRMVLRIVS